MLALPPGYASAIFPPAGIAITAIFVAGTRVLPAIFLGSLILNIWVGFSSNHHIELFEFGVATLIAIASALQALIGGHWLKKNIGYPTRLDNPKDVVRFFVSAPFICVISASVSVTGLYSFGLISQGSIASSLAAWQLGG